MKKIKKIGIAGWWGGKNEGDDYIRYCLKRSLGEHFRLQFIDIPFKVNRWCMWSLNNLDFLLVGGGGLFTRTPPVPFHEFENWGRRLTVPFGFFGIGVQEIAPHYRETMGYIVERSTFFGVRDTESLNLVKEFSSQVFMTPDLSFLYPRQIKRNPSGKVIGVNLRIWDFDENRTYPNQRWVGAINSLPGLKKTIPLSFLKGLEDESAMNEVEGEKNHHFDMSLYENLGCMIGMRLHSVIFSIQNAIPTIGIAYAPKVERFFSELNLEDFCLRLNEYDLLREKFEELLNKSDTISDQLSMFTREAHTTLRRCLSDIGRIMNEVTSR